MKSVNAFFTFLLFVCPNVMMAQQDSTLVSNDSITWNKELESVVIKAQKQLIKQDIDRIGYDVQNTDCYGHVAQGANGVRRWRG